jgi:hypothetical protein
MVESLAHVLSYLQALCVVRQVMRCTHGNCQNESESPYKFCAHCRSWTRARRQNKVLSGLCRYCSKKARLGQNQCELCATKRSKYVSERRQELKHRIIDHYGGKCVCCGESEILFLTVDHIQGGGKQHRKTIANGGLVNGEGFYRWLRNHNFPEGFQILCWNCNCAKGIHGECPHVSVKSGKSTV